MECLNQKVSSSRATKAPLYLLLGISAGVSVLSMLSSLGQSERSQTMEDEEDAITTAHSSAILTELKSSSEKEHIALTSTDDFLSDLVNYTGLYDGASFNEHKADELLPQPQEKVARVKVESPAPEVVVESAHDKAVKALQERRASALLKALSSSVAVESVMQDKTNLASSAKLVSGHGYEAARDGNAVGVNAQQYLNDASARLNALNSASLASDSGVYTSGASSLGTALDGRTMDAYNSLAYAGSHFDTTMQKAAAAFTLMQGSVVPCVLLTGVNSDVPGMVQAQVISDVYDSTSGEHVLIPKGSKLLGQYASGPMRGQKRMMFGFNRLIFPNGRSMQLGSMPASSRDGYAGIGANVDNRFFEILSNAILLGGVTAGIALSVDDNDRDANGDLTLNGALSQGLGQSVGRVITQIIERNMNIAPTLTIKPGYEFNITLMQDINFAN